MPDALFDSIVGQHQCPRPDGVGIPVLIGKLVSDECAREAVGIHLQRLYRGFSLYSRHLRDRLEHRVRHADRVGVRFRLAQVADRVEPPRLLLVGEENGLGYPEQMTGIPPDTDDAVPLLLVNRRSHRNRVLELAYREREQGNSAHVRRTQGRSPSLAVPSVRLREQSSHSGMNEADARGYLPSLAVSLQALRVVHLDHVAIVLAKPSLGSIPQAGHPSGNGKRLADQGGKSLHRAPNRVRDEHVAHVCVEGARAAPEGIEVDPRGNIVVDLVEEVTQGLRRGAQHLGFLLDSGLDVHVQSRRRQRMDLLHHRVELGSPMVVCLM